MVNVNVCTTAFYTPQNLAAAMREFQKASFGARMNVFCKGVRVQTKHLHHRKTIKAVAHVNARQHTFDAQEHGVVTVAQYFEKSKFPLIDITFD